MEQHAQESYRLAAPSKFAFPFEPYSIQVDFMKSLYHAIEDKKIGIFESPTGTGKSLSLICGSLTWLKDHEEREEKRCQEITNKLTTEKSKETCDFDWIQEYAEKKSKSKEQQAASDEMERRKKRKLKLKKIRSMKVSEEKAEIKANPYRKKRKAGCDETVRLMKQAKMDIENFDKNGTTGGTSEDELTVDDLSLALDDYNSDEDREVPDAGEEEEDHLTRIFFCSRTHSQLSQFVKELQKSPFGNNVHCDADEGDFQITMASLGSRNNLCINDSVRKLKSVNLMNERCLEMQKNSKPKSKKEDDQDKPKRQKKVSKSTCCYYTNHDGIAQLTNTIVGKIHDIEEVIKEGKSLEACPYYASRHAVTLSQLVVLPYQTLLHKATRQASGIKLKDSVVIIDEAHNLVEALNSMHSCLVTAKQLSKAYGQLSRYAKKFNSRLKARNLFYVKQLLYVLNNMMVLLKGMSLESDSKENRQKSSQLLTVNDFLFKSKIDNINFFKLLRYCERSKISRKLGGFVEKFETDGIVPIITKKESSMTTFLKDIKNPVVPSVPSSKPNENVSMSSPLMHIESLFAALSSANQDGRVVMTHDDSGPAVKYLLLNPASHFQQILEECRALIVAGGTMQPSSCLIDQLLAKTESEKHRSRIVEFSCGHVIDGKRQLLPLALSSGPSGVEFEFTFQKRSNFKLIDETGRLLLNISNIIPGGVVCFFPSYDYERFVVQRWQDAGILSRLEMKKKIFREPKKANEVDKLLTEYTRCVKNVGPGKQNGGLLLSVVGGKMSEGINFSDDLGRCVVMVGLPYPNSQSPELREKMNYLDRNMKCHTDGRTAGQVHYENLCMKAVNQSIGRAIRHRNDYASIILLDKRYSRPSVANKLPKWISNHLSSHEKFGSAFASIKQFFHNKKTKS
uniref:ATP-dependent DNA helicase DDX11 isoform X2 n=1 Tax=Ciona intestinalis TaxID=7719 RepID=UPI000180D1DC|nr:ATP-dependent DNA helicase DDX11 isoform X2 [Ciona intestinalis]|eukprot:XP_026690790.1 ATP-dependent DNA helicase DDX11 isoform X2 [Ciona intestinalis]